MNSIFMLGTLATSINVKRPFIYSYTENPLSYVDNTDPGQLEYSNVNQHPNDAIIWVN